MKLSMRAANNAADTLEELSSGLLKVSAIIRVGKPTPASPKLRVVLKTQDTEDPPEVIVPAPKTSDEIEAEILRSIFKLVGSRLALRDDLRPVSAPDPGEKPADSLRHRITRLAWKRFAESLAGA
ncbi:MAG: hypothetical protein AAGB14_15785 [Verrucomicrobiota bacterium]